jgi:DNA-binding XRE family transcriptional regulator
VQSREKANGMKTIRALRMEQGWTQFELAVKVGVQPQAVYLWESGRRMPAVPQVRKLGQLFGICSDEIILEHPGKDAEGRSDATSSETP